MNRNVRSSVLLAACVALWSCTSDPTGDMGGTPDHIIADPSTIFVVAGETEILEIQLYDDQGGPLAASYTVSNTSPNIDVTVDEEFLPEYDKDGNLVTPEDVLRLRVAVTGLSAASTSFTVSAGGVDLVVPVRVLPVSFNPTFEPAVAAYGDTVLVTAPAGYTFSDSLIVSSDGVRDAYVVSVAPDGTSALVIPAPGTNGPLTIDGVFIDFAPGARLTLPSDGTLVRPIQDDPLTAPEVTIPGVGESVTIFDVPGSSPQFYKFVLGTATTLKTTIDWADADADIDVAWYDGTGAFLGYFGAGTGAHPEVSTHAFAAGTYEIGPEIYDGDPGAWYSITIEVISTP
ncbi:MAG TPA: hypothetical protein VFO06_13230 [Gemmatimonadales bacterium]|nr:hypothetical protein [Gemmatimonadales bacterium]